MPNLFPDLEPTIWSPRYVKFDERDQARNGFVQINDYDDNGFEQFHAAAEWQMADTTEKRQLLAHWRAHAQEEFTLFDWWRDPITDLWFATGDGATLTFTLPGKNVVGQSIKHNGVVAGTQPTLTAGTGPDGEDQVTYLVAPANGVLLTFDATEARRRYSLLYVNFEWAPEHREADLWIVRASFIEAVAA